MLTTAYDVINEYYTYILHELSALETL